MDGYISSDELALIQQFKKNIEIGTINLNNADFVLKIAHSEKKAAEADLRAAQAEYNGAMIKMLWKYKLETTDSLRQSDGLIIKGDKNGEENDQK